MPSVALQQRASWLLSLCSWGNKVVLWKIGQNILGPCMDMQWKCVFYTLQGQKEISLSSGDNESRYCFEWVWVVSVGTKLVAIKWPVRSKTIMKKTQGVFFFLPIYFIVSKLSQCITTFHGWSPIELWGIWCIGGRNDQFGVLSVFVCESLSNLCSPLHLSVRLPVFSSDTKPTSVLSAEMDGLGRGGINLTPASSSNDNTVVIEEC